MKHLFTLVTALALAGCAGIGPEKPVRATLYDFGPGAATSAPVRVTGQGTPIVLQDLETTATLEGSALLYRLGYADAHELHPYSQARWSAPPVQLVRQRLREVIGRDRPVLDPSEAAAMARVGGTVPRVLRVEIEEFSHYFESPTASFGLVRLRATLLENGAAGEKLLAQRTITLREPAPGADAAGGVRALAAATQHAGEELRDWLAQAR